MPRPELSTLRYPNLWQGCVGAWCPSQSGATGYRLFDDSGNNNHGVLTGMDPGTDWVPSSNKLALDFDGSNDGVSVGSFNMNTLNNSTNCVSLWINPTTTNTIARPFSVGEFGTGFALRFNFQNLEFTFGGTAILSVAMDNASYAGKWTHVLGVTDNSGARLFFNGVQVGTRSDTVGITKTIGLGIGYRFGVNSDYFTGQLDDICLYNRALAPYEIRQLASSRGAAYERSRGRKKAYVPGYRITAPSRIQTGSARTIDGTDTESLSRGLVGAWCPSLGASGFRLIDRSGYGNHGVLTGMDPGTDWVPSGGKLALDFDGVNDYVDTGSNIGCNGANYRTISHWFKRSTNSTSHFLGCWGGSNAGGDRFGFYLLAQTLYVVAEGSGAGNTGYASWNANSNFYEWTHLLLQYDGSQPSFLTRLTLAVNGTFVPLLNPIGTVPTSLGTGLGNFFIGYNQAATQPYTTGQVDDVRLYRRPLTAQEVRLLYTGGRGVGLLPEAKPKRSRIVAWDNQDKISVPARVLTNTDSLKRGLVGHWSPSLSGPQGNRLMDLSDQNNHGTLQNMDYQTDYVPSAEKGGRLALDFDGTDDNIVGGFVLPAPILPNSISAWVNVRSGTANRFSFRSHADISSSTGVWLRVNGSNSVIAGYGRNTDAFEVGNSFNIATSNDVIGSNTWVHIAAIIRGLNNHSIYINGIEATVTYSGTQTAVNGGFVFNIGRIYTGGTNRYGAASADDIRYYNRALTPSEIRLLAQSRMPERATPQRTRTVFYSSGLVSYLRRRTYNSILGSGVLS